MSGWAIRRGRVCGWRVYENPTESPTTGAVDVLNLEMPHIYSPRWTLHELGHDRGSEPPEQGPKLPRKLPRMPAMRLEQVRPKRSGNCRICGDVFPKHRPEQILCGKKACRSEDARRIMVARRPPKPPQPCRHPLCDTMFTPTRHRKAYCSRECALKDQRKHSPRNIAAAVKAPSDSRYRQLDGRCHRPIRPGAICGGVLKYESVDGRAMERCPECREERPVAVRGIRYRKYDQARVRDEGILASVERAKKKPLRGYTRPGQGDAWRQESYKKKRLGDLRVNSRKDAA